MRVPRASTSRHERAGAENRGEPESARCGCSRMSPASATSGVSPAEKDELLAARVIDVSRDEVADTRGIERDLVERASAGLRRAAAITVWRTTRPAPIAASAPGSGAEPEAPVARAAERVRRRRTGSRRARDAPGPRAESTRAPPRRGPATSGCRARARSKAQSESGEEHRDRPEQMADALLDPVRRDRERQPAGQRRPARQTELAQPGAGREAREARRRGAAATFQPPTRPNTAPSGQKRIP